MLRPTKAQAIQLAIQFAPKYVEMLKEFQAWDSGWIVWSEKLLAIKKNLNLDHYVIHYRGDHSINNCLLISMMGKKGFLAWSGKFKSLSLEEQQAEVEAWTDDFINFDEGDVEDIFGKWPETLEEEELAKSEFASYGEEARAEAIERACYLFAHIFSGIHNYLALMVLGEKMTSIVPRAINGDDEAFFRAIRIDRNLLEHHPYFVERVAKERAEGSKGQQFLKRLGDLIARPQLTSRIRYPGLYIIFAILESTHWLDDLTHSEILDICEEAGLDRWQNRIEDVTYLTKRLIEYRRYQRTEGVSMH